MDKLAERVATRIMDAALAERVAARFVEAAKKKPKTEGKKPEEKTEAKKPKTEGKKPPPKKK